MAIIIKKVEHNIGKIAFLVIYSLIAFFFLINAESIFPGWDTNWTYNSIIYLLGVTLFLTVVDELPRELKTPISLNIKAFAGASVFTLVMLLIISDLGLLFDDITPLPYHLVLANMAFHLVIVASSEEIIFRGVIFGYLYDRFKLRSDKTYGWVIPYFLSALIFALFHYAVYGLNLGNMLIVFIMGLVFAYATERWGIGASIGAHWIWNCMAIGVFSIPFIIS